MRKFVIAAVVAVAVAGGSVAVAAVNPLGFAGAQDDPGTTAQPQPPTSAPAPPPQAPGRRGPRGGGGPEMLKSTLDELVANGTITEDQENKIIEALKAKMGGRGRRGPGEDVKRELFKTAADTIGITPEQLMQELKGGKSIAEVAQAHGVEPQAVIDAVVAKIDSDIDQAVAKGRLSADRAAKLKEEVPQHVADMVNRHFGDHMRPGGPGGPPGPRDGSGGATTNNGNAPTPAPPAPAPGAPTTAAPSTTAAPTTTAPHTKGSDNTGAVAN